MISLLPKLSPKLLFGINRGLILAHRLVQGASLLTVSGMMMTQVVMAAGPVIAPIAASGPAPHPAKIELATNNFDPQAAPEIRPSVFQAQTGTVPGATADQGSIVAKGPVYEIAKRIIQGIFFIAGVAAAVVMAAIGLKILIASGAESGYGVSKGIYALLGAGAGLVIAFAGPAIAGIIIGAAEGGGLGTAASTNLTLPGGAK
jgi:hypothetical protein